MNASSGLLLQLVMNCDTDFFSPPDTTHQISNSPTASKNPKVTIPVVSILNPPTADYLTDITC